MKNSSMFFSPDLVKVNQHTKVHNKPKHKRYYKHNGQFSHCMFSHTSSFL